MKSAFVIFARAPVAGRVKTRLAETIGAVAAARLYTAMLRDTLELAQHAAQSAEDCRVILAFTPADAFEPGENSLAPLWDVAQMPQRGADLGARMLNAMGDARNLGAEKIVIIGSDSPDLPPRFLFDALHHLQCSDWVFGPARDGGFYLIGASLALPDFVFEGVAWSSNAVLKSVLKNARALGLKSDALAPWRDVDDGDDLSALRERLDCGVSSAPATMQFLKEHLSK